MNSRQKTFKPKRILLPTDLSEGSLMAMRLGLNLANQFKSQVDVLTVFEKFPQDVYGDVDYYNDGIVKRVKQEIHKALENIEVDDEVRQQIHISIRKGRPSQQIITATKKNFNDLIVMATHGWLGIKRMIYGSMTEEVVKHCKVSTLAIKPIYKKTNFNPENILVPIDFSKRDSHALRYALRLKRTFKSKIHILHVIPEFSAEALSLKTPKSLLQTCQKRMTTLLNRIGLNGKKIVCFGNSTSKILEYADDLDTDLILIPARDKTSKFAGFLGSVSSKVVRHADCDVLTIHP